MNRLIIFNKLYEWLQNNNFESFDVCDIDSTHIYYYLNLLRRKVVLGRYIFYPFFYLSLNYPGFVRKILGVKKQSFPQAQAIICRAYLSRYLETQEDKWLTEAKSILQWLKDNRNKEFMNFCWGQPYDWLSKELIPANTPRATVTSQVADAFLDAFEITNNRVYLEVAESACQFYIDDLNWEMDSENHLCFSYTTKDKFLIHNASMLASAVLIRTWYHNQKLEFKKMGIKALNYTMKHQNQDGSWYYWVLPDNKANKIDNYHTGFILESLETIRKYLGEEFYYEDGIQSGLQFYLNNLFDNKGVPKLTPDNQFPIDIQSCAQSIITLGIMKERFPGTDARLHGLLEWTINNFYDKEGFFYYRVYKNGMIDKTPYVRWAESWMLRALMYTDEEKL